MKKYIFYLINKNVPIACHFDFFEASYINLCPCNKIILLSPSSNSRSFNSLAIDLLI